MITVSAKFPRKNSLTLGMAIILTCLMGVREARAQGNDLIDAAVKGD